MRRSPRDSQESFRGISRRGLLLASLQGVFATTLAFRMRYLQLDQADEFRLLAEENSIKIRLLPPARGLIHDRNGALIAGNEQNYRIMITREDAGDTDAVLARLAQLIPLTEEDIDSARKEIERRSPTLPITVADRLSWEDFSRVAVNAPALPGVTTEVGLSRVLSAWAGFRPCPRLCRPGQRLRPVEARGPRSAAADPALPDRQARRRGEDGGGLARQGRHQADRGQRDRPGDARA